jgi:cobalt/nickel transport system permease protein
MKPLWTALALLLILTPLGTLAGGAAWGEWGARDFSDAAARRRIAAASRNLAPPPQAPHGLERLYSVWTAPFPQYAPSFVRRPALGYLLSAMFGSGVIILVLMIVSSLSSHGGSQPEADSVKTHTGDT